MKATEIKWLPLREVADVFSGAPLYSIHKLTQVSKQEIDQENEIALEFLQHRKESREAASKTLNQNLSLIPSAAEKTMRLINIKAIEDGYIKFQNLSEYAITNFRNADRYVVHPDDIIITSRGTQLKIVVVPQSFKRALISAHLIAIRLRRFESRTILPLFLAAYLKTEPTQEKLKKRKFSSKNKPASVTIALRPSDIRQLEVPILPLPTQEKIVTFIDAAERIKQLNKDITKLRVDLSYWFLLYFLSQCKHEKPHGQIELVDEFINFNPEAELQRIRNLESDHNTAVKTMDRLLSELDNLF